jgi:hypothetical protein
MRIPLISVALLLTGCVIQAPPREVPPPEPAAMSEDSPADAPVTSVEEQPPIDQPSPVVVGWAPPPMLVEVPPPMPYDGAAWVGGYWVWRGDWVWAHGYWMAPPRPAYVWVHPYYEHRGEAVIFIDGHWSAPGVAFVPPPRGMRLVVEQPAVGVIRGPRPIGPEGCFVPPPPGSRHGIIVPAPIGTAPAVVTSAPPVIAAGMRVTNNVTNVRSTNITHVTNVTNVTIIAPPNATANHHAFNTQIPAAPQLAAARPAVVQAHAPAPNSARPITPYAAAQPPSVPVHPGPPPHGVAVGHESAPARGTPMNGNHALTAYSPPPAQNAATGHDPHQAPANAGNAAHQGPANNGAAHANNGAAHQMPANNGTAQQTPGNNGTAQQTPGNNGVAHGAPQANSPPPAHGNSAGAAAAHGNSANEAKSQKPDANDHHKKPDHEAQGQQEH